MAADGGWVAALLKSALEEPPLWLRAFAGERRFERVSRLRHPAKIEEQLPPHREQQMVTAHMRIALERRDGGKTSRGPMNPRNRHRPIQRDYGRGILREQIVIQPQNE